VPRTRPKPKTATRQALMLINVRVVCDATRDHVVLLFSTRAGREHTFALNRHDARTLAAEVERVLAEAEER
jgi:hypothetical protein